MPENKKPTIATSVHPEYYLRYEEWVKFRYILDGGTDFIEKYVKQYSVAEDSTNFVNRKEITPVAAFAKAAVKDVNDAIFQRMHAIRRRGGTKSWLQAVNGRGGGVDLMGSTMNHFLGTEVLPELLAMGKVGIFVDNYNFEEGRTRLEAGSDHPYLYTYRAEDIKNWQWYMKGDQRRLKKLVLRVSEDLIDAEYLLINGYAELYRYFWEEDGVVLVQDYDAKGNPTDKEGNLTEFDPIELKINQIPMIILELQSPLLQDIANHQIALTNFESADTGWLLRSNIPVYTEQYDQRHEAAKTWMEDQDSEDESVDQTEVRKIGSSDGVRYPTGHERPAFIHPSPEPLKASMEKQKQLKDDIRALVNLSVANTRSRFASAESKQMDERGLESGLSAIGLVLEHAEARVAQLWAEYESSTEEATVRYPERYSLRSEEDRRKDADQLANSSADVSSPTFRKEIQKEIAEILLAGKIPDETLDKIRKEIDASDYPTANGDQLRSDVEIGLVSREFASTARGYPKGESTKARAEKLEAELARMKAQTKNFEDAAARGLTKDDPESAEEEKEESQNPENNSDGIKKVRGEDQGERKISE